MAGNIIGQPIRATIAKQVEARQKIYGADYKNSDLPRSSEIINYQNNKNAWIKLASGVSLKTDGSGLARLKDIGSLEGNNYMTEQDMAGLLGKNLAQQYVLFNSTQQITPATEFTVDGTTSRVPAKYTSRSGVRNTNSWKGNQNKIYGGMGGNDRGLQPVPGLISCEVESVNRGSIKKAKVKIKAFNKFQFGIIELLYLRLGYIMLLEFGWDKYVDSNDLSIKQVGSTITEDYWFDGKNYAQNRMLNLINGYTDKYQGNYHGFFGKVSNFSWDLKEDNTYDITINLISMGSIIESLNCFVPSKPLTKSQVKKRRENLEKIYTSNTAAFANSAGADKVTNNEDDNAILNNLGSDRLTTFLAQTVDTFKSRNLFSNKDYYYLPNAVGKVGNTVSVADTTNTGSVAVETGNTTISAGTSAIKANRNKIPPTSRYYIRLGKLLKVIEDNVVFRVKNDGENNDYSSLNFDTSEKFNRINYEPNLIPLDPSICIFKPVYVQTSNLIDNIFLPEFEGLKTFVKESKNVYYGQLMNVYMNVNYVAEVLESNRNDNNELDLFNFLQKMMDGVSRCMGGLVELVVSIKDDTQVYILDENPINGYDTAFPATNEYPVTFDILGFNPNNSTSTFVKNFGFQTKITPKLMSQISIGATAAGSTTNAMDAVGYKNWNKGFTNRYQEVYRDGNVSKYVEAKEESTQVEETTAEDYYNNIIDSNFKSQANWVVGAGYAITYKTKRETFINPNYSFWDNTFTSKSTYFEGDGFRDLLKDFIIRVDNEAKNIKTVANTAEELDDYPSYLIDAFGGVGENFKLVATNKYGNELRNQENADQATYQEYKRQNTALGDAMYWYGDSNKDFINRGFNAFKRYYSRLYQDLYEQENLVTGNTGFIPVTLKLNVEGLSGIKIYNSLNVDAKALPYSYPQALKFLVDGVGHKVENGNWQTDISTISQPKTDPPPARKLIKAKPVVDEYYVDPNAVATGNTNVPLTTWSGDPAMAKTLKFGYDLQGQSSNGLIYWPQETKKIQFVLHHTAGNYSIDTCLGIWRKPKRAKSHICTHFILQRDGTFEQTIPLKYWGNHIGSSKRGNSYLQKHTVSIELEGLGYLKKITSGPVTKKSKFKQGDRTYTYEKLAQGQPDVPVGRPYKMNSSGQVVPWNTYKGYDYYQTYTRAQLKSLKVIIDQIKAEYPTIRMGVSFNRFYEMFPSRKKTAATTGLGTKNATKANHAIFTHNSYRSDKIDVWPQKELIELLKQYSTFS